MVYPAKARDAVASVPQLEGVDLVFPGPSGRQLWSSSFSWLWKPVRSAFGRPTMALHELRHFCATYLLELGLAPADVAVQLDGSVPRKVFASMPSRLRQAASIGQGYR